MFEQPFSPDFEYIAAMVFRHMGVEYTPPYMDSNSKSP